MLRDRRQRLLTGCAVFLALLAAMVHTGCEIDSASDNNLVVSPERVELRFGQSQEFTVTGGFTYTWSLSEPEWGTLSTMMGDRVVYTSRYDPGAETERADQVLTVVSTLENEADGGSTSNGLSIAHSRSAIVTHVSQQIDVTVLPATATLQEFESVTFTASGARTYAWSLQRESWGVLSQLEGPTTTYTSLFIPADDEDIQQLYCDTDEGRVTIYIIHELGTLAVTPTSATVTHEGSQAFTASGGDEVSYTWSLSPLGTPYASISPTQGTATVLTGSNLTGENQQVVVTVTSGGQTASAIVTISADPDAPPDLP